MLVYSLVDIHALNTRFSTMAVNSSDNHSREPSNVCIMRSLTPVMKPNSTSRSLVLHRVQAQELAARVRSDAVVPDPLKRLDGLRK